MTNQTEVQASNNGYSHAPSVAHATLIDRTLAQVTCSEFGVIVTIEEVQ
ncbi:MAG: hypothetical protein DSM106950_00460 [Stigonema ocellatum SAG 48.90 = DSM 106950]|nr:hypothetical protein [Stigonema ocellatum SAG 48.90 = DSM 106950]